MTDQTPQGELYGPQSTPGDSRDAGAATEAGDGRTAGASDYYAPDLPIGCALPTPTELGATAADPNKSAPSVAAALD